MMTHKNNSTVDNTFHNNDIDSDINRESIILTGDNNSNNYCCQSLRFVVTLDFRAHDERPNYSRLPATRPFLEGNQVLGSWLYDRLMSVSYAERSSKQAQKLAQYSMIMP